MEWCCKEWITTAAVIASHSLSTSYALGDITPITFLCLHKISHLRNKWIWRSSQEIALRVIWNNGQAGSEEQKQNVSKGLSGLEIWVLSTRSPLPNLNEVSKERKREKKKGGKRGKKKEGKRGRERGREGSESVLKSRRWCYQLSRQCMHLNHRRHHHLQPLICNSPPKFKFSENRTRIFMVHPKWTEYSI